MTALTKYARLEAAALWRASPDAQRRDVIIVLGDATLTIRDSADRALTHWSLAALTRANPGKRPAIYHPDGDAGETIELSADEDEMIRALEKLRKAVERARPRQGRLRSVITVTVLAALGAVAAYTLPEAITEHALRVVPQVKRAEIGNALLTEVQRVTGPPCAAQDARPALSSLSERMSRGGAETSYIAVMRTGVRDAVHLPGGVVLLGRALVEDYESPDVVAGYILAEHQRRADRDPLRYMLESSGTFATLRLLTSGVAPQSAVEAHARKLLTDPAEPMDSLPLLQRFAAAQVPSSPYAYAVDLTGESVLDLVEGDPYSSLASLPVLDDGAWVRLQTICEDV